MAGFLDKKNIIEKAKKDFDIAKEKVLTNSGKEEYTDKELHEAIQLTQNELVSYVNDRAMVIERLKAMVDKSEKVESVIHNLFMEKYPKDDYCSIGKNNLWLLDDRFTTYSYAASDTRISEVLKDINEIYFIYYCGVINDHASYENVPYEKIAIEQFNNMNLIGGEFLIEPDDNEYEKFINLATELKNTNEPVKFKHIELGKIDYV